MNKEIKEILDKLQECVDNSINEFYYPEKVDNRVHMNSVACKVLLDYITNLQQAVKNTKETADDMLYELSEENERLRLELSGYREAILRDDKLLGLQQRIEKAVEYIKKHTFQEEIGFDNKKGEIHYGYFVECKAKELLNILNGRSNE